MRARTEPVSLRRPYSRCTAAATTQPSLAGRKLWRQRPIRLAGCHVIRGVIRGRLTRRQGQQAATQQVSRHLPPALEKQRAQAGEGGEAGRQGRECGAGQAEQAAARAHEQGTKRGWACARMAQLGPHLNMQHSLVCTVGGKQAAQASGLPVTHALVSHRRLVGRKLDSGRVRCTPRASAAKMASWRGLVKGEQRRVGVSERDGCTV